MKVIRYRSCDDFDVQFLDEHGYIKEHVYAQSFKLGSVKNPYDKTVCGVGYLGVGKYHVGDSEKKISDAYNTWKGMLERCYYDDVKHPAYFGICEVCDEWLNYQNFAKWFEEHRYKVKGRLHLDKDILFPGNKIYSPKHCILIPQRINMLFTNMENKSSLPNGVRLTPTGRYSSEYSTKHLGTFDTLEEAFNMYAKEKEKTIMQTANDYKGIIPSYVYEALMKYEVKIENDKNYVAA